MTREEAKAELDACTLRPGDASAEARALAELDPELAQWLKERAQFDEAVAKTFQPAEVSSGTQARLLAAMQEAAPPRAPTHWRSFVPKQAWMAAAAAVVLAAASYLWTNRHDGGEAWQSEALALVAQVDAGQLRVDHVSNDLSTLKAKLAEASSPLPGSLPKGITAMTSLACKVVHVGGRPASIVCFRIAPGREAHLVVMNNQGLRGEPPQHVPQFSQHGDWHVASWSDGDRSYLLASQADVELLKKLFASTRLHRAHVLLAFVTGSS